MRKISLRAAGLLFLGSLVTQQVSAGTAFTADFNTFDWAQAGEITSLGPGEGSNVPAMLDTTFFFEGAMGTPVSLTVDAMGPGGLMTTILNITDVVGEGLCLPPPADAPPAIDIMHCALTGAMFDVETLIPVASGDIIGAAGTLGAFGGTAATTSDAFAASVSVPEPAILGLMAAGLFGVAVTRRKRTRQQ